MFIKLAVAPQADKIDPTCLGDLQTRSFIKGIKFRYDLFVSGNDLQMGLKIIRKIGTSINMNICLKYEFYAK